MVKRAVATVLWFFTGWYVGAFAALLLGVPDVIGPILGPAAAALVGVDPFGVIWSGRERTPSDLPLPAPEAA